MNIFFLRLRQSASLYALTKSRLKRENPDLHHVRNLGTVSNFRSKITSPTSYKIVPFFVIFLWLLCFINYGFYNDETKRYLTIVKIDCSFVSTFIDQRISNIATITSISLVVVGFLINNIKEKTKETYEILFRETFLYSIVYFILSAVALLLLSTFLRDSIPISKFSNFIILSMILILAILICIGFLFSKLLQFATSQGLNSLSQNNLLKQAKIVLYEEKMRALSQEIMLEFIMTVAKPVSSFFFNKHPNHIQLNTTKERQIKDINIKALKEAFNNINCKNLPNEIEFLQLHLFQTFDGINPQTIIAVSDKITQINSIKMLLKEHIHVSKPLKKRESFSELRSLMANKLKTAIDSKDMTEIHLSLNNYNELYNLYFNNFKK